MKKKRAVVKVVFLFYGFEFTRANLCGYEISYWTVLGACSIIFPSRSYSAESWAHFGAFEKYLRERSIFYLTERLLMKDGTLCVSRAQILP